MFFPNIRSTLSPLRFPTHFEFRSIAQIISADKASIEDPKELDFVDDVEEVRRGTLLMTSRELELAKSRAQLAQMRSQVEQARQQAEAARREIAQLREHVTAAPPARKPIPWKTVLGAVTAFVMLAAIAKIAYLGYTQPVAAHPVVSPEEPPPVQPRTHAQKMRPAAGKGDVTLDLAINHLQDAFDSLPENSADIVREVNARSHGGPTPCPLEWPNGEVALSLEGKSGDNTTLLGAVNRCATAVEKLAAEHESTQQ